MMAWSAAVMLMFLFSTSLADRALLTAWYAIVPFHYFADSRIWRRRRLARSLRGGAAIPPRPG
jgi:hypothetical protein